MSLGGEAERVLSLIEKTVDNLVDLGVSEDDARRAIEPLSAEVSLGWVGDLASHLERQRGAETTALKAEHKKSGYQVLADIVIEDHPTWRSKRRVADGVIDLIKKEGIGGKHSSETIRKAIKIPS